ncbi:MAG: hypothetical protein J6V90_01975 [Treponema sp.]|nr:hypothetical protein [Treponema sp.]
MKFTEVLEKSKEKCILILGKMRPALDYVAKRKKRFILGGIGALIVMLMLYSVVSTGLARKKRSDAFDRVFRYGSADLSYNQKWSVYQCKDGDEAEAVIWWVFLNEYGETEETAKKVKSAFAKAIMNKDRWDEKFFEKWYENFLFYNHVSAVEEGDYIVYLKDEDACLWWSIKYNKWLLRKYGKSIKAISWKNTTYAKISLY